MLQVQVLDFFQVLFLYVHSFNLRALKLISLEKQNKMDSKSISALSAYRENTSGTVRLFTASRIFQLL